MFRDVDTTLDKTKAPIIDSAMLTAIDEYADRACYGYMSQPADFAGKGCRMEGSTWYQLGAGQTFTMRFYAAEGRSYSVGEGAFVEVVDMGGDFYRIYGVVDSNGYAGYTLSDT